jgi:hypothetical protein
MRKIDIKIKHRVDKIRENAPRFIVTEFVQDHAVQLLLFGSLILILSSWVVGFIRFVPSEYDIPLRYDSFLGVTRLGSWYELYRIPFIATLVFAVNYFLGSLLYKKDKMLGYIMAGAVFFVSILALIVTINLGILIR